MGEVRRRVFSPHRSHDAFILSTISSRSLAFSRRKVCCPRVRGVVVVSAMLSSGCFRPQDTAVYIYACVCTCAGRASSPSLLLMPGRLSTGFPTLSARSSQSHPVTSPPPFMPATRGEGHEGREDGWAPHLRRMHPKHTHTHTRRGHSVRVEYKSALLPPPCQRSTRSMMAPPAGSKMRMESGIAQYVPSSFFRSSLPLSRILPDRGQAVFT